MLALGMRPGRTGQNGADATRQTVHLYTALKSAQITCILTQAF